MRDIILMNFDIGFIIKEDNKEIVHMYVDEHGKSDLSLITISMFKEFLDQMVTMFTTQMTFVNDRNEDLLKLKGLELKTINLERFSLQGTINSNLLNTHIGSLAVLCVYNKELYDKVISFATKIDGVEPEVLTRGKEARRGVSIFTKYLERIEEELIPLFPIDAVNSIRV